MSQNSNRLKLGFALACLMGIGFAGAQGLGPISPGSGNSGILVNSAANTMLGNWSASTANPSAKLMPSCSDVTGNHLNYVNGTGVTCGTSVNPNLGTPTTLVLTSATGLPISTGVTGLGTGVATFLTTPSSANLITAVTDETGTGVLVFGTGPTITLANGTGLPIATGVSGLGANVATFLATPSSANFAAAVTGETGTGSVVFSADPTFTGTVSAAALTTSGANTLSGITSDATHTDSSVCQDTTTHVLYAGSGTVGICLGTSSLRYKHDIKPLAFGLDPVMKLNPVSFYLNKDHGDPEHILYGFIAEDMEKVFPALVGYDAEGKVNTADYVGLIAPLVKAVQEQQAQIAELQLELKKLQAANDNHILKTAYYH